MTSRDNVIPWSALGKAGLTGWLVSVIGCIGVFYGASWRGAIPKDVYVYAEAQQPLTVTAVVVTTTFVVSVSVLIFRFLVAYTEHPRFYFRMIAVTTFIFMIVPPHHIEGAPRAMKVSLWLMHGIVTGGVVWSLEKVYRKFRGKNQ